MKGHRAFAGIWDWAVRREPERQRAMRRRVAGGLRGRVLEIGFGVGTNWAYLPDGIEYSGVEPDPYMLRRARKNASDAGLDLDLRLAPGEALPFDEGTFDAVLVTLTLCSVEDQGAVVDEIRRVLKPEGSLHFWEHVRPKGRVISWLADVVTPAWKRIGGGCHPNRRTIDALRAGGFTLASIERVGRGRFVPFVAGVATPPRPRTR